MKNFLLVVLSTLFTLSPVMGQDWNRYEQEVVVEFANETAAASATLTALELPPGKTLAVGSRWDDSTPAHLQMTQTLSKHGWKGTFFLTRCEPEYFEKVVSVLLKDGSSVGAHSMTHPQLGVLHVNQMYQEIMGNRVNLESITDRCVTTFTFPYGLYSRPDARSKPHDQGEALRRAGLFGGPEYSTRASTVGLKKNEYISPFTFDANDKDPNPERFAASFQRGRKLSAKGALEAGPCLVLGVHSLQGRVRKDGFERLGDILATEANRPEYWYCNSNEYAAWRLGFLNNTVTRKSVDGRKVVFTLSRVMPMEFGSVQGMAFTASSRPINVTVAGKSVAINEAGQFEIPNDPRYVLPERIGRIDNPNNESETSDQFVCSKIDGVRFGSRVDLDKNVLFCSLTNTSQSALTELYFTVRLPLRWKTGIVRRKVDQVEPGKSLQLEFPLGPLQEEERFLGGPLLLVNECNFRRDGHTLRIYSTVTIPKK